MRIVERYLARSLFRSAAFTFLVLGSLVTMMVFSIMALRESMTFLTVTALLEVVGLLTLTQLEILIPLTVLIASIWTYGKAQADGEINAMREAGMSLFRVLQPAALLGALACLVLVLLGNRLIPWASYEQRLIGKRFLAESVDRLLEDERTAIRDRRFKCRWSRVEIDETGRPYLEDFVVAELENDVAEPVFTRAGRAIPFIDGPGGRLVLELHDLTYSVVGASESMRIALDLRALSEEPAPRRRAASLDYEELYSAARDEAGQDIGLQAEVELHARGAGAVSALLFSFLGAALGVLLGIRNRATIFAIGFLLVILLYFAPRLIGESLGARGLVAPGPALWCGNVLILGAGLGAWRRSRRR
ncbi:MAG: LptF/LptG family permease [Planctomycetes bacterium]|nr:LptF/LptG family permease [Planctomycetota bacterium]